MKKRDERLSPVIEIAEHHQQDAARQLSSLMQHQDMLVKQKQQLENYRKDYHREWFHGKNLSSINLHDHQQFLNRLNKNIALVSSQISSVNKSLTMNMKYWQQTRSRTRALEKVVERYRATEQVKQVRLMQKEQDEHSGMMFKPNSLS